MSTLNINVPTGLANLGQMVQTVVGQLADKQPVTTVLTGALPVLFAEGSNLDELKAELKDPQVCVLAGLVLGGIAAKLLGDKIAGKAAAAAAAAAAAPVAPAPAVAAPAAADASPQA